MLSLLSVTREDFSDSFLGGPIEATKKVMDSREAASDSTRITRIRNVAVAN